MADMWTPDEIKARMKDLENYLIVAKPATPEYYDALEELEAMQALLARSKGK